MKVAISGVGGGVGQSIIKALSISTLPVEAYAIDVQPLSAGLYRCVEGAVLPFPERSGGIEVWADWLTTRGIKVLIPGSDHDLLPLAAVRDDWIDRYGCHILISDLDLVQTARDKLKMCERLEREGFPVPKYVADISEEGALSWAESCGYPIVIKPREGSASKNVNIVNDGEELLFFFRRTPHPILQEYLDNAGKVEEFTCAVFVNKAGSPVGTIMAQRDLSGGSTYRAEVKYHPEIHKLLIRIGRCLRPRGPLNVQLRLTPRGPVPFEINMRCSGSSAIRAFFGYNEPEMLLRHFILGEDIAPPQPRHGFVFRYWNEVFLEGIDRDQLRRGTDIPKGKVLAWP